MEKHSISSQLDTLFCWLKSIPFPDNTPLGSLQGGGCKDARRGIRFSSTPIMNAKKFEDFIFEGSVTASPEYTDLLRSLTPASQTRIVFTHGDVRPANIMVTHEKDDVWRVAAIIDWESSGFYPSYWESVKTTNNLMPGDRLDWYKFLPRSISPRGHPTEWLIDRLWDRNMVNS